MNMSNWKTFCSEAAGDIKWKWHVLHSCTPNSLCQAILKWFLELRMYIGCIGDIVNPCRLYIVTYFFHMKLSFLEMSSHIKHANIQNWLLRDFDSLEKQIKIKPWDHTVSLLVSALQLQKLWLMMALGVEYTWKCPKPSMYSLEKIAWKEPFTFTNQNVHSCFSS